MIINQISLASHIIWQNAMSYVVLDKRCIHMNNSLYPPQNICCGYSLEAPSRGASNEYPQHVFRGEKEKYHYFCWHNTISVRCNKHSLRSEIHNLQSRIMCLCYVFQKLDYLGEATVTTHRFHGTPKKRRDEEKNNENAKWHCCNNRHTS